jgi:hypothetical protein
MSKYNVVPKKITVEPFNMSDAEIKIIVQQINIGIVIMIGTIILGAVMFVAYEQTRTVLTVVLSTLIFFYSIELIMLANMVKVHIQPSKYETYRNTAIAFATLSAIAIGSIVLYRK